MGSTRSSALPSSQARAALMTASNASGHLPASQVRPASIWSEARTASRSIRIRSRSGAVAWWRWRLDMMMVMLVPSDRGWGETGPSGCCITSAARSILLAWPILISNWMAIVEVGRLSRRVALCDPEMMNRCLHYARAEDHLLLQRALTAAVQGAVHALALFSTAPPTPAEHAVVPVFPMRK